MFLDSTGRNYIASDNTIIYEKKEYKLNSDFKIFASFNDEYLFMSKSNELYYTIINSPVKPIPFSTYDSEITHLIHNDKYLFVVTKEEIIFIDEQLNETNKIYLQNINYITASNKYIVFSIDKSLFYIQLSNLSKLVPISSITLAHRVIKIHIHQDDVYVITSRGTLVHKINLINNSTDSIRLGWRAAHIDATTLNGNKLVVCLSNSIHFINILTHTHSSIPNKLQIRDCLIRGEDIIILTNTPDVLNYKFTN